MTPDIKLDSVTLIRPHVLLIEDDPAIRELLMWVCDMETDLELVPQENLEGGLLDIEHSLRPGSTDPLFTFIMSDIRGVSSEEKFQLNPKLNELYKKYGFNQRPKTAVISALLERELEGIVAKGLADTYIRKPFPDISNLLATMRIESTRSVPIPRLAHATAI